MKTLLLKIATLLLLLLFAFAGLYAPASMGSSQPAIAKPPPRQMENLGRGVVALNQGEREDIRQLAHARHRSGQHRFQSLSRHGGGEPVKINAAPISDVHQFRRYRRRYLQIQRLFRSAHHRRRRTSNEQAVPEQDCRQCTGAAVHRNPHENAARLHDQRLLRGRPRRRRRIRDRRPHDRPGQGQRRKTDRPIRPSCTPTSSTAPCSGASTSARTSAKAPTTRSSWSTTSTATAGPRSACKTADGTVDGTGKVIGDPKAN